MSKRDSKTSAKSGSYTLWTIPRAEWQTPSGGTQLPNDAKDRISGLRKQTANDEQIRPFRTSVTEETMSKSFDKAF